MEVVTSAEPSQTFATGTASGPTEDQQIDAVKPVVLKQEEQDETSVKPCFDTVGLKDVV